MKPFTFSEYYNEWLASFRMMFPGGAHGASDNEATPKTQAAAQLDWEDEGGTVKPEKKPDATKVSPAPKMPL